jgi:integrase
MSTLRNDVTDYLATRRAMGFKVEGLRKLLLNFVTFCEAHGGARHCQNDLAVQWATTPIQVPVTDALIARRMDAVRVFTEAQVLALVAAADSLSPRFKAITWRTLIGLLAATGMRPGEACRLSVDDVDLPNGVLQVLETKFGKSRLVFIHPTTATVLRDYLLLRRDWVGSTARACPAVFVNSRREAINPDRLGATFRQVVAAAGITTTPGHRPPRLHDLRHTYTVTTILGWYRDGHDVQARLPLLSTWLGHVDPASTYWYLHAVPELLAHAAGRLEEPAVPPTTEPTP